ncbi:hypothetical protein NXT08_24580 (plasmid) [Rhodococcus pyridinivorans]|uniref:hypothetical protein n=1 Tax=Rhodococcus pyridinivorans TaxID=103816 RepID=UPI002164D3FD|nr:hypothetical protein [Rhodococcus pyridinivorans]UVT27758.1 hypothetical protein NXT08_24580 [Rhodococcus pyridinivorans]
MKRNDRANSSRVLDATAPRTRMVRELVPVSVPAAEERFSSGRTAFARESASRVVAAADVGRRATHPTAQVSTRRPARKGLAYAGLGLAAVGVVGLAGWGLTALVGGGDGDADFGGLVPDTATAAPAAAAADDPCSPGEGDQLSGEGVIAALEHRYYLLRSGESVRELMAPDAPLPDAAMIQQGIDTVPLGTTHCLEVTAIGPNTYSAQITEVRPDRRNEFKQRITTTTAEDGRVMIRSIEEVGA